MLALGAPGSRCASELHRFLRRRYINGYVHRGLAKAPSIAVQTLHIRKPSASPYPSLIGSPGRAAAQFLAKQMQQHLQPARHLSAARPRRPRGDLRSLARQAQQLLPPRVCSGSTGAAAFADGLQMMNADSGTPSGQTSVRTLVIRSFTRFIFLPRKPPALRGRSRGVAAPAADVGGAAARADIRRNRDAGFRYWHIATTWR